jgi:C-terminal processing protease CtpA/Prc
VFPWAFQELGLGKLVGTPVAGTGTAVWWERQIDPSIVFGIPQVGLVTTGGRYLENLDLRPDVEVVNDPESRAAGRDLQLERAVAEAVAGIGK